MKAVFKGKVVEVLVFTYDVAKSKVTSLYETDVPFGAQNIVKSYPILVKMVGMVNVALVVVVLLRVANAIVVTASVVILCNPTKFPVGASDATIDVAKSVSPINKRVVAAGIASNVNLHQKKNPPKPAAFPIQN